MNIIDATAVINAALDGLRAYNDGKLYEHELMLKPCFDQLNEALDQVWHAALTSPKFQRMPD